MVRKSARPVKDGELQMDTTRFAKPRPASKLDPTIPNNWGKCKKHKHKQALHPFGSSGNRSKPLKIRPLALKLNVCIFGCQNDPFRSEAIQWSPVYVERRGRLPAYYSTEYVKGHKTTGGPGDIGLLVAS